MPLHQSSTTSVSSSTSSVPDAGGDDLTQFVAAFKEMAVNLDEDAARNLLAWSPLFLPTVEGLMRQGGSSFGSSAPRAKPKLKGANPREVRKPAPHPRHADIANERVEHMKKLKAMYMQEVDAPPPSSSPPPPPSSSSSHYSPQPPRLAAAIADEMLPPPAAAYGPYGGSYRGPARGGPSENSDLSPPVRHGSAERRMAPSPGAPPRSPSAPPRFGTVPLGAPPADDLGDDWEDDVDDLLDWTSGLPEMI